MWCVTLRISSGYSSLIYPCITVKIGGHRRLTQSTHEICMPTYNRSQTKRLSAILNLQYFDTLISDHSGNQTAAAHQISLKSDDPQLRYSDETIFKMGVVRYLVNWTINRWDIAKNDFQYDGRPPFWIYKILILCHVTVLRTKICSGTPNFIEIGWSAAEI